MYVIIFLQYVSSFVLVEIELNNRSHWILGHTLVCSSLLSMLRQKWQNIKDATL